MFFFCKRKEVVLDCFTFLPEVYEFNKIDKALNFIPQWWKETPKIQDEIPTIKNCPGFIEYYKNGIVIPSWFEMEITISEDPTELYSWRCSSNFMNLSDSHHRCQFVRYSGSDGFNIKINSPWIFRTKEEINFTWTQPTWNWRNLVSDITLLPAVINYKYQHFTEINLFLISKDYGRIVNISPSTPLVMMHPITEKNVIVKNHLVDEKEWNGIRWGKESLFLNKTLKERIGLYRNKKRYMDEKNKCPFFGDKT